VLDLQTVSEVFGALWITGGFWMRLNVVALCILAIGKSPHEDLFSIRITIKKKEARTSLPSLSGVPS
jgi:hypothetical protein